MRITTISISNSKEFTDFFNQIYDIYRHFMQWMIHRTIIDLIIDM